MSDEENLVPGICKYLKIMILDMGNCSVVFVDELVVLRIFLEKGVFVCLVSRIICSCLRENESTHNIGHKRRCSFG